MQLLDLNKHRYYVVPYSLLCVCVCISEDFSKPSTFTFLHTNMAAQLIGSPFTVYMNK